MREHTPGARPYRYRVTAIHNDLVPNVEVGTVLRENRHLGQRYTYQIEQRGTIQSWATVEFVGLAKENDDDE